MIDLHECNGRQFYHKVKAKLYKLVPINWIFFAVGESEKLSKNKSQ